jgi:hypothetical protein
MFQHWAGHMPTPEGGIWELDYQPVYGGYLVQVREDRHHGVRRPFGDTRHSAGEMWELFRFANMSMSILEGESRT